MFKKWINCLFCHTLEVTLLYIKLKIDRSLRLFEPHKYPEIGDYLMSTSGFFNTSKVVFPFFQDIPDDRPSTFLYVSFDEV